MIRHEIEIGDEVLTDDGRSGVVRGIMKKTSSPPKNVAVISAGAEKPFEHPVDSLRRIHPRHSLNWTDAELAALWLATPVKRNAIKAVTFARRVLQGRPE
jgi:hypothetical protein